MAHFLITGGAGFIGSHTAELLLAQGGRVTVLDNLSNGKLDNLAAATARHGSALNVITADVRDAAAVDAAAAGCDAVLHLAAQVSVQSSVADPVTSASHNITGFLNVLDAVRRLQIPRMVYASSAAVYGHPVRVPLTESDSPAPLSPYGLEKFINDQYARLYGDLYGVCAAGMRYFNVYGPRQDPRSPYAGVISKFADALMSGTPLRIFGDGRQTRDFIYVGDVAQANARVLASDARGVFNVGTGRSVSLLQLVDAMGQAFGAAPQVRHEPPAAGDIMHSATTGQRLAGELQWQAQVPLVEGLRALANAMRAA